MAPSFTYPPNLLHKNTEPQWFPKPKEEHESSLDALEAAEEAHSEFLRSIAMKEAPDPIGIAPVNNSGNNNTSTSQHNAPPQQQYGAQAQGPPETGAEVTYPAPASTGRTRFWNQPRTPASTRTSFSSPAPTHRMEQPSFS